MFEQIKSAFKDYLLQIQNGDSDTSLHELGFFYPLNNDNEEVNEQIYDELDSI